MVLDHSQLRQQEWHMGAAIFEIHTENYLQYPFSRNLPFELFYQIREIYQSKSLHNNVSD